MVLCKIFLYKYCLHHDYMMSVSTFEQKQKKKTGEMQVVFKQIKDFEDHPE